MAAPPATLAQRPVPQMPHVATRAPLAVIYGGEIRPQDHGQGRQRRNDGVPILHRDYQLDGALNASKCRDFPRQSRI